MGAAVFLICSGRMGSMPAFPASSCILFASDTARASPCWSFIVLNWTTHYSLFDPKLDCTI